MNEVLYIIMINSNKTWVLCWWWKVVNKVWVNVFWFFFSDCVLIYVFKELFLPSILSFMFYMCIKKVSVIMVIVHRIYMFIWVLKVDWVHFWSITRNRSLKSRCVGCISVLLKSLSCDMFLLLLWRRCSMDSFFFVNNVHLKGKVSIFLSCWINNFLTTFLLSPHPRKYSSRYLIDDFLIIW